MSLLVAVFRPSVHCATLPSPSKWQPARGRRPRLVLVTAMQRCPRCPTIRRESGLNLYLLQNLDFGFLLGTTQLMLTDNSIISEKKLFFLIYLNIRSLNMNKYELTNTHIPFPK